MVKKEMEIKEFKKLVSILMLSSIAVNLNIVLIAAYFNNGVIKITVNQYNEGLIEIILVPIITILSIYVLIKSVSFTNS